MSIASELTREFLVSEGINDKNLFKAILMAGGPGSGKGFVVSEIIGKSGPVSALGAVVINSDTLFEAGLAKHKISTIIDPSNEVQFAKQMAIRDVAKKLTATKQGHILNGMLPIVIDGTGRDTKKLLTQKKALENIGYDVSMVFVNTTLEVAKERNLSRSRVVPDDVVTKSWSDVQQNIAAFQSEFGNDLKIIDNSKSLSGSDLKDFQNNLFKIGRKILESPLKSGLGKAYKEYLKRTGGKLLSDIAPKPNTKVG